MNYNVNHKQRLVLAAAFIALVLIFIFPPYSIEGGLIGGSVYTFFHKPPDPYDKPIYDTGLISWEIFWVFVCTHGGWAAQDARTTRLPRRLFMVSLLLQIAFFVRSIPHFSGILEPEFTWLVMDVLAVVTSVLMFVWIRKAPRELGARNRMSRRKA